MMNFEIIFHLSFSSLIFLLKLHRQFCIVMIYIQKSKLVSCKNILYRGIMNLNLFLRIVIFFRPRDLWREVKLDAMIKMFRTFRWLTSRWWPLRKPVLGEVSELQVWDCESDDRRFVELGCDCRREGQHFGQFIELIVFLPSPRSGCVARFLFPQLENAVNRRDECLVRRVIALARIYTQGKWENWCRIKCKNNKNMPSQI